MLVPPRPDDDAQRVASLRALGLVGAPSEERFDRVTRLAQRVLDVPIALVTLIDRDDQWLAAARGLEREATTRDESFCAHAILTPDPFVVQDALDDPRFVDNPFVVDDPSIRFYAGIPLATPDGHRVGTLCVIDREPRDLDDADLGLLRDLADVVEQELAVRHEAVTDRLTGLHNRRGLEAAGATLVEQADRDGVPLALLFVDLDGMKPINDEHGHAAGDVALVDGAALLRGTVREADAVARLGGDEFVVVLCGAGPAEADAVVDRLAREVLAYNADSEHVWELGLSVGAAIREPGGESFDELLARADAEMYAAKKAARYVRDGDEMEPGSPQFPQLH